MYLPYLLLTDNYGYWAFLGWEYLVGKSVGASELGGQKKPIAKPTAISANTKAVIFGRYLLYRITLC